MIFIIGTIFHFFYIINLTCNLNKFNKYNQVNISSYKIKYSDLLMYFDFFPVLFLDIINNLFLLTHMVIN